MKLSDLSADDIEDFIRDNYDQLYKYCYWKVKNHSDAEDLTQETFLRFVGNLTDYTEQGKPKALLYTIARNLCINWYKQIKLFSLSETQESIISAEIDEITKVENRIAIEQYLGELPLEQQEILMLRYGQELQVNEIAHIMKITRFTVMYRIKTAISTLNKKIGKGGLIF